MAPAGTRELVHRGGDQPRAGCAERMAERDRAAIRVHVRRIVRHAQIDVIELNEAFAAQGLAVLRDLGLADDDARVNPNGGAIALGHPLGMSGARLLHTASHELVATGGRYALATMCVGVGQGMAVVLERA